MDVRRDCVSYAQSFIAATVPLRFARCLTQDAQERCLSTLHDVLHMDVRRDCVNFAHRFIAGAARVSFAQSLATYMGAEVARYLSSGLATSTSLWARSRHPCRSRSESKVPHTLCAVRNHSGMVSDRCNPTPA